MVGYFVLCLVSVMLAIGCFFISSINHDSGWFTACGVWAIFAFLSYQKFEEK